MNTSTTEVSQEFDSSVDETAIEVSENTAISSDDPTQSPNDAVDPSEANEDDELVISLDGQELTQDNEDHKQAKQVNHNHGYEKGNHGPINAVVHHKGLTGPIRCLFGKTFLRMVVNTP